LAKEEPPLPPGTESPADAGLVTEAPQWREKALENQEKAKEGSD
jgi:hypothetical protein